LAAEPARPSQSELQQRHIEGMARVDGPARAVRLDAERTDLGAPQLADPGEPLPQRVVDREVHGRSPTRSSSGAGASRLRPASSRAAWPPPSPSESTRASRIHFSTG